MPEGQLAADGGLDGDLGLEAGHPEPIRQLDRRAKGQGLCHLDPRAGLGSLLSAGGAAHRHGVEPRRSLLSESHGGQACLVELRLRALGLLLEGEGPEVERIPGARGRGEGRAARGGDVKEFVGLLKSQCFNDR